MARLNEAVVSIDPVELLRRKYSRQNKEIARINSTQCIRIRNLENEVSRLLAENLDLREQIIRLQTEFSSSRSQNVVDHVRAVKADLEAKLLEFSTLVTALEDVPHARKKTSIASARKVQPSPTQSPDQKNWRNMYTLSEAVGLHEDRLSPILEDKSYPRRTLEPSEIQNLCSDPLAESTESPDIGPPPVSQFINQDPLKIGLLTKSDTSDEGVSEADSIRSINLEQRRKRRSSNDHSDQKRGSRFEQSSIQSGKEVAQSLKTGAKRKLSTRDEQDRVNDTKPVEVSPDEFKYTRKTIEAQAQPKALEAENKPNNAQKEFLNVKVEHRQNTNSTTTLNARKVLGPKTTNTDVANSPKKNSKSVLPDEVSSEKKDTFKQDQIKERPRERRSELVKIYPLAKSVIQSNDVKLELETPAALDLMSPLEPRPSTHRTDIRDTPPPSDLGTGMEGNRPSRRARGSVSYVEPNLRDKMRRPTKELVDAVVGDSKANRLSNVKLDDDATTAIGKVKEEIEQDDTWKNMPSTSVTTDYSKIPLTEKVNSREELPVSPTAQRNRRRSLMHQVNEAELPRSGSSSAISALLGGGRKNRLEQSEISNPKESLSRAMEKLDIYEFTGSSPREPSDSRTPAVKAGGHESKSRRGYSTGQDIVATNTKESLNGEQPTGAIMSSSRRRQSVMGLEASASHTKPVNQRHAEELRKSSSNRLLSEVSEARGERLSARRRSMML